MSAMRAHFLILIVLCLLGIAEGVMEFGMDFNGSWISRYAISKIIWLGIGIYALLSTVLVILVGGLYRHHSWSYTPLAVLLTHGIPVMLIVLGLSLGVHDRIVDALRNDTVTNGSEASATQPPLSRPMLPPPVPLSRQLPQTGGMAESSERETASPAKQQ